MARQRRTARQIADAHEPGIDPNKVYDRHQAARALTLGINRIREEVQAGRLRCSHSGMRQLFRGQWLLDWLEAGGRVPAKA